MKRWIIYWSALVLLTAGVSGSQEVTLGGQAGYFQPWARDFRDIYGGGIQVGIELSIPIKDGITAWAGGGYFRKTGLLTFTQEAVTVRLFPFHLALGYQFSPGKRLRPFVGFGLSLNYFREATPLETVERVGLGPWGQAGISWNLTNSIAVEAKFVFNSLVMNFPESKVDLSGISGLIGLKFSL